MCVSTYGSRSASTRRRCAAKASTAALLTVLCDAPRRAPSWVAAVRFAALSVDARPMQSHGDRARTERVRSSCTARDVCAFAWRHLPSALAEVLRQLVSLLTQPVAPAARPLVLTREQAQPRDYCDPTRTGRHQH